MMVSFMLIVMVISIIEIVLNVSIITNLKLINLIISNPHAWLWLFEF